MRYIITGIDDCTDKGLPRTMVVTDTSVSVTDYDYDDDRNKRFAFKRNHDPIAIRRGTDCEKQPYTHFTIWGKNRHYNCPGFKNSGPEKLTIQVWDHIPEKLYTNMAVNVGQYGEAKGPIFILDEKGKIAWARFLESLSQPALLSTEKE